MMSPEKSQQSRADGQVNDRHLKKAAFGSVPRQQRRKLLLSLDADRVWLVYDSPAPEIKSRVHISMASLPALLTLET